MCDPGEKVSYTMKREFMEEALNSYEMSKDEIEKFKHSLNDFFHTGVPVKKILYIKS